mmetsp:Transcript_90292/g.280467  ORF Transcript_90292/g.280467 Transcript_90292/m.280467 type:complete len:232 (-) Transcript_90292:774-1469(-)
MCLRCHHNAYNVVDRNRFPDDVLAERLQAVEEKALGNDEEVNRQLVRNVADLVRVDILQEQQKHVVANLMQHNLLVRPGRLSHAAIEERTEVFRARRKVRTGGVDRLVLHKEGDICESGVVDELSEVIDQVARWYGDGLESELIEVIQHNAPIVTAEDVQRVVEDFCHQRGTATWRVFSAEYEPCVAVEPKLVQVVQPLLAAIPAEEEQGIAVDHTGMEVARRWHLGRLAG